MELAYKQLTCPVECVFVFIAYRNRVIGVSVTVSFKPGTHYPCSRPVNRVRESWVTAGMGKRGHLPPPPCGNVVKCFCTLVVIAKRSVDELFMHYFHNLSSASGGFAARPHRKSGAVVRRPLICPHLEKKPCGCPCREHGQCVPGLTVPVA